MKKLFALRGATCAENIKDDIVRRIAELYDELLQRNNLLEENIVSIIFSITDDLSAINPAAALRSSGRAQDSALFSTAEPNAGVCNPRTVRVLIHCYLEEGAKPLHVYRNGAEVLRPDRALSALKPLLLLFFIALRTLSTPLFAETVIEEINGSPSLRVESAPSGAKIFIDGIERGKTPLDITGIPAGSHNIVLTKDNYADWQRRISFSNTGRVRVAVDLIPARTFKRERDIQPGFESGGAAAANNGAESIPAGSEYHSKLLPLSLARLLPGLAYSEAPLLLPARSFQVEAAVRVPAGFSAALRISPASLWEISAVGELKIRTGGETLSGAAGLLVRRELFKKRAILAAGGVSFTWVQGARESNAGLYAGAAAHSSFYFNLPAGFAVLLSPAIRWTGDNGYPAESAPQIEGGAGILFNSAALSGGISTRNGFSFAKNAVLMPELAIEVRWIPSNIAVSTVFLVKFPQDEPVFLGELTLGFIF